MIDMNEVVVFIKVVESGSFSGAAKSLGYPRTTVSRKVSQLEKSLGVRLLQRSTRKLNLTESGREYYLKCSSAISDIEHANQLVTDAQQIPNGVLRIAAPLASQSGFMCDWITEFLQRYTGVTVEVRLSDDLIDLIESGIDIAFRAGKLEDSSLVARKLGQTKLVLCASPSYLKQSPAPNTLIDLKKHACILFGSSQKTLAWRLEGERGIEVVQVNGRVVVNSMEFVLQACLSGLGIAILPIAMITQYVAGKKLHIVLNKYASEAGGLYVIYPSKKHLSITARTFIDFVIEKADQGLPWKQLLK